MFLELLAFSSLLILPLLFFILKLSGNSKTNSNSKLPKSYPIISSFPALYKNYANRLPWFTELLQDSPTSTITMHHSLGCQPATSSSPPTRPWSSTSSRQSSTSTKRASPSVQLSTTSLAMGFSTPTVTIGSSNLPATEPCILDFQDILQRFAFDNICRIGFGYDPEYLLPSLPQAKFAVAFDNEVQISSERFSSTRPVWKIKRALGIGSESHLHCVVSNVREFANTTVKQKKHEMDEEKTLESHDLLSRFLSTGHSDEKFVTDIVISFTLAGRDTTSAALTWFFWLISNHPKVENQILKEINEKTETGARYDEAKEMVYTHVAICESMRLYPPVPTDNKEAVEDDVLPDGTKVKNGTTVTYHVYVMGRMEQIWGKDWAEFRPER
ncbi:putative cytochrome P450 [Rosa chinensis]|uniref:Putative cytochrome P450 n=1 Tax=Rosa chinensis TaxID=74649 RepID=A0A2P6PVH2_ROSCH|nr:putative cytochrome P450 [Rosa chinensis]